MEDGTHGDFTLQEIIRGAKILQMSYCRSYMCHWGQFFILLWVCRFDSMVSYMLMTDVPWRFVRRTTMLILWLHVILKCVVGIMLRRVLGFVVQRRMLDCCFWSGAGNCKAAMHGSPSCLLQNGNHYIEHCRVGRWFQCWLIERHFCSKISLV
jgi:hypothetical protein